MRRQRATDDFYLNPQGKRQKKVGSEEEDHEKEERKRVRARERDWVTEKTKRET